MAQRHHRRTARHLRRHRRRRPRGTRRRPPHPLHHRPNTDPRRPRNRHPDLRRPPRPHGMLAQTATCGTAPAVGPYGTPGPHPAYALTADLRCKHYWREPCLCPGDLVDRIYCADCQWWTGIYTKASTAAVEYLDHCWTRMARPASPGRVETGEAHQNPQGLPRGMEHPRRTHPHRWRPRPPRRSLGTIPTQRIRRLPPRDRLTIGRPNPQPRRKGLACCSVESRPCPCR